MAKRKAAEDHVDMFAELELREKTAHFPAREDWPGAFQLWRALVGRFDVAMLAGDTAAAVSITAEAHLLGEYMHGEHCGCASAFDKLKAGTVAPAGTVPVWGQSGEYEIEFAGVRVAVKVDGLCGIGSFTSLLPHFEIRIVETHRMFLSSSGYRSFFSNLGEAVDGLTLGDAVRSCLDAHFRGELKGKLVRYISPEEGREIQARHTAEALAERARRGLDAPAEAEDDDEDDELLDVCCDCGDALAQLDEFFECYEDGGSRCPTCAVAHRSSCVYCAPEAADEADDVPMLPTLEHVPEERAEAAAEAEGERLTDELLTPRRSISKRTGAMEIQSPLFRNSAANPQGSLFGEVA